MSTLCVFFVFSRILVMHLFANTAPPVRQDLLTKATDACVVLAFVVNTVRLVRV